VTPPSVLRPLSSMPDKAAGIGPFQANGQARADRDDQPERMPGKSKAPERGEGGRQHQGVQGVIEADLDRRGVDQGSAQASALSALPEPWPPPR
jgi:hypothetical protein